MKKTYYQRCVNCNGYGVVPGTMLACDQCEPLWVQQVIIDTTPPPKEKEVPHEQQLEKPVEKLYYIPSYGSGW